MTARVAKNLRYFSAISASSAKGQRIVIIGGVAGGATAAARIMRLNEITNVKVIERSPDVSFANCGLPYYIGGEIKDRSRLALQTPESLSKSLGIEVLTNSNVTKINKETKEVVYTKMNGETMTLPYDKLILSPGASPIKPKLQGIDDPRVVTLRNLQDMDKIVNYVKNLNCKRVAVIGAGFIGLEMVEQLHRLNKTVTLIEKSPTVLPQADEEMGKSLSAPLIENGIQLITGDGLLHFETSSNQAIKVQLESGKSVEVDLVILSIGVLPDSQLAKQAGLSLNSRGYIVVDEFMRTSDPSIYAVGDVIETTDLVFPERRATVALGNIANMQARIAADHIVTGKSIPYSGSLGTSIVRVFDTVLALTGWNEKRLKAAKIPYETTIITDNNHASYYPGALPITLKLIYDPTSGRIYGAQAYGVDGVDKRIDAIAVAITGKLTVDDLSLTQLCYSPPFGSARDVVNIAGLAARNSREGFMKPAYSITNLPPGVTLVDVRPKEVAAIHPIPNSINIPSSEIAARAHELDRTVEYRTVCNLGKTSYFAHRHFVQAGFKSTSVVGGMKIHSQDLPVAPVAPVSHSAGSTSAAAAVTRVVLDCSGLACPGPLLKMKDALNELPANSTLHVIATDAGFKADVKAFASANGLTLSNLTTDKGVIRAELTRGSGVSGSGSAASPVTATTSSIGPGGATIVLFSQDYDKAIAAFIIGNGAKAMGGDVTIFCTFWGLNALRHPHRKPTKPKSLIDNMFATMMPKGISHLPLSNMNFGGAGSMMLKDVMKTKNLPNLPDLLETAKKQGIRIVACTMSMDAMGIQVSQVNCVT